MQPHLREKSAAACDAVLSGRITGLDDPLRLALQDAVAALASLLVTQRSLNLREVLDAVCAAVEIHVCQAGERPPVRYCDAARTVFEYVFGLVTVSNPRH